MPHEESDPNPVGHPESARARFSVYDPLIEGCLVLGPDEEVVYANEAMARQLRRPREALLGRRIEELLPGISARIEFRQARDSRVEESRRSDLELPLADGSRRWLHLEFRPLADGLLVLALDISEGKSADERFRALIEKAPFGIFVQTNRRFAYLNPAAAAIFGAQDAQALLGEPVLERIAPRCREQVRERIRRLNEDKEYVESAEQVLLRKDGSEVFAEVSAVPIVFGNEHGALAFMTDLTDRRLAAQERNRLEEQLRQSQKMEAIGRLAGGVAHDFNNLLMVILGYSEVALASERIDEDLRGKLLEIRRAGECAAALTRQLLAFSRQQVRTPSSLDLSVVVGAMQGMLGRLLGERVQLTMQLAPRPSSVEADPHQIEQVVLNLAVNAGDAMPEGGNLRIEVAEVAADELYGRLQVSLPPGHYVVLSVTDDGCGMDAATRERIFEPFFTTKLVGKGTGLGLSTVYGIVAQNGGEIRVDSAPGAGTTFRIYLPRVAGAAAAAGGAPLAAVQGGDERILVVEDQQALRELLVELLSGAGYQVTSAASGTEALGLESAQAADFDLVLTDVVMPGLSGPELVEQLQLRRPGLPALFMSGHAEERLARRGQFDPARNFLSKPFTAAEVTTRIRRILDDPQRLARTRNGSNRR